MTTACLQKITLIVGESMILVNAASGFVPRSKENSPSNIFYSSSNRKCGPTSPTITHRTLRRKGRVFALSQKDAAGQHPTRQLWKDYQE